MICVVLGMAVVRLGTVILFIGLSFDDTAMTLICEAPVGCFTIVYEVSGCEGCCIVCTGFCVRTIFD